ncbi:aminotransferase class I and II-domain-containing protein [Hygrophoropsis aurantiaca]|uniref:Aminotransferase class I and II-domain-containing protein n=1 Tax=Hygrophoropsis aurantiaca TaxID=72124 RepID=A0ACB8AD83_9AGAM|nr:aminotransferase class I and II-domain-containing protein [Hygrophoropsis aurantiaca]
MYSSNPYTSRCNHISRSKKSDISPTSTLYYLPKNSLSKMPILGLAPSSEPTKPAHFDIEKVIRPNILALHPYRCARDDYQEGILLDANENALGHSIPRSSNNIHPELQSALDLNLNRYPDPSHDEIKSRIASLRSLPGKDHVFLGVGSDEVIDLIMRVCVAPAKEKILITPPTYGMYAVCAQVNDVAIVRCNLNLSGDDGEGGDNGRFSVRVDDIKKTVASDPSIKLIFLCSPGNPTGTLINHASLRSLLDYEPFKGIVIVDEAYIDFAGADASTASLIQDYANLCVMQTLSKSFGLAAIRLGVALAQPPLIQILTNTKAPYNISTPTAQLALAALSDDAVSGMRQKVGTLVSSRSGLLKSLENLSPLGVGPSIGGNDANFVVVPILNQQTREADNVRSEGVYKALAEKHKVVVRFRGKEAGCTGCLRITVGTTEENQTLMRELEYVLNQI